MDPQDFTGKPMFAVRESPTGKFLPPVFQGNDQADCIALFENEQEAEKLRSQPQNNNEAVIVPVSVTVDPRAIE